MYWFDHDPPHFHARYQGHEATFLIDGGLLEGDLPDRQCRMVSEWARRRRAELAAAWEASTRGEAPGRIEPLR